MNSINELECDPAGAKWRAMKDESVLLNKSSVHIVLLVMNLDCMSICLFDTNCSLAFPISQFCTRIYTLLCHNASSHYLVTRALAKVHVAILFLSRQLPDIWKPECKQTRTLIVAMKMKRTADR
jgi:hypothetical protein